MALGLNRHNDTPIGGLPEFRGNMQGGEVFGVDDVPAWDGGKFAPASNSALLYSYGGLSDGAGQVIAADGTAIGNWDAVMPVDGTPQQMTVDAVAGTLGALLDGTYEVSFSLNCTGLTNAIDYDFFLSRDGIATGVVARITGSNQVDSQSTSFTAMITGAAGGFVSILAVGGGNNFTVGSMSLSAKRIG
jgi:hypothetical protein